MDKQFRFVAPKVLAQANLARIVRLSVESDGGLALAFKVGDAAKFDEAQTFDVKLGAATLSAETTESIRGLFATAYNELVTAGHLPAGAEEPVPAKLEAAPVEAVVKGAGR